MRSAILLAGLVTLAGLLFIVASLQVRRALRKRNRRPASRGTPATLLPRVAPAAKGQAPQAASPLVPGAAVRPAARGLVQPARAPAASAVAESADAAQPPLLERWHGKVVVHYADGKTLKGFSHDFHPNKPWFHLLPSVPGFSFTEEAIKVLVEDLKAVFFVRDFEGDFLYRERKYFLEGERSPGQKVQVTFRDGEVLVGSTVGYGQQRRGFFLIPADPRSKILSVFVVSTAVTSVRPL